MAAPTPHARVIPTGYKLPDGFRATITLANKTNIQLWEREVTPPGIDGGPKIDTTTMLNTTYRTYHPQSLITVDDGAGNVAYDPDVLGDILANINVIQSITYTFRDGTTETVWGHLQSFKPSALAIGQMPMASIAIATDNVDPTASFAESGPAFGYAPGT